MSQRLNDLLLDQYGITYGAVLTLCQPRFGTGGSNRAVNDFGVACCENGFLFGQYFTADGTVFALRLASVASGGRE